MTDAAIERLTLALEGAGPDFLAPVETADLRTLLERIKALEGALPDLSRVIAWIENGCAPVHAATELRIYQARIEAALNPTGEPRPATANFHTFTPDTGDA